MKNSYVTSVHSRSRAMVLVSSLFALLLVVPASYAGEAEPGTNNACISVGKTCNTVPIGLPNTVTAGVTNCGDVPISNIQVNDNVYGLIGTIPGLPPHASTTVTKLVTNTCGFFPNVVMASGIAQTSNGPVPVQASATAACQVTENPCIRVTKTCDTVLVGQPNFVTAVVTNCGNAPLHGILVTDNLYGSVGTVALLAPGGTATLTKFVTNTCGNFPNTVTATGLSPCNTSVTNTSTATCVVTENPCIGVTKTCNAVVSGQPNLITAVVTNCGNVPLHGITVVDNLYGSVGTIALLAPGGIATLTKSVTNTCGNFPNTVTATGLSPCNTSMTNTSTATCVVTENPCIGVSKFCDVVLVGQPNLITAVVTNCGNVPLHGITVVDNLYGSVGTIALLAPGGFATLTKSVTNTCGNFPNTVTATGLSPCNTVVTNTGLSVCVVLCSNNCPTAGNLTTNVNQGSQVNFQLPASDPDGDPLQYQVTQPPAHGVVVVNINSGAASYTANAGYCGPDSFKFRVSDGQCQSTEGTVFITVTCEPKICVTKEVACELPTGCGSYSQLATGAKTADDSQCPSFCYRVRVTNCGQEALNNVTVVDNVLSLAGCNFPTSLAVGQTVECIIAGVEHCDSVTNTVTASGVGASSGIGVSTNDTAAVQIQQIAIACNATVNGQSSTTIRCNGQSHLVTNAVEICNTGELPLANITIHAPDLVALGGDCTNVANLRLSLLPGECTNVLLCTETVSCPPDSGCAYSNQLNVTVTGVVDTNTSSTCSWTRNVSNQVVAVTASSSCSASVVVVVDTTPPQVACIPGVNPSDKKIPVAGKNPASGQNPDGYYKLLGRDNCDPNPAIYVADSGSSFIAGPFASGDVIKLTQSPGKTPSQDPAPAPIVAHLHFKGDGLLFAVDANGNVSEPVLCLVPRPPK